MTDAIPLGEVIATRAFELRDPQGGETQVLLLVGKPVPDPREGGDWGCPYALRGFGSDGAGVAFGIDSVQALRLALLKAAADLRHFAQQEGKTVTWLEDADLDLT